MDNQQRCRVQCPENEAVASYLWNQRQQLADSPKGLPENTDKTLHKAYANVCNSKTPIQSLKDLSLIKGVGKWILKLMQGFFDSRPGSSASEDPPGQKKVKGAKRYVPQKNSVAYALLITLHRGTTNGNEFMRKQELIDAAEASGLSRVPIVPEKGKGRSGSFGSSQRDWYTGWNCMKTLITKGLVVKSSNPAKYMLTQEGREAARECLIRSGLVDSLEDQADLQRVIDVDTQKDSEMECDIPEVGKKVTAGLKRKETLTDIPTESLQRFTSMGFSRDEVIHAFAEVSKTSQNKDLSSLWPAVLCFLRESHIYGVDSDILLQRGDRLLTAKITSTDAGDSLDECSDKLTSQRSEPTLRNTFCNAAQLPSLYDADLGTNSSSLRACSSRDIPVDKSSKACPEVSIWTSPPLSYGEKFDDVYEVILVLDDREQFATQGSRSRRIIENICAQFKIKIEVRRLPVGDGIWIARHKYFGSEFVLDFIVERKNVNDLRSSIRDNRYKDQKLRLLRCGLKKLIYLVEGDPNSLEAAESIKTACFTTEILEGFDVQRTNGLGDTLRKYGQLTQAISQYYRLQLPDDQSKCSGVCPPYDEFVKRCQDLDKMTVSDVFAIQLMQVPQVTEEVAIAVLDMFPTLLSLARAYSNLEGDISAQEDMLRKQSNNVVSSTASKNIFRLVWGS